MKVAHLALFLCPSLCLPALGQCLPLHAPPPFSPSGVATAHLRNPLLPNATGPLTMVAFGDSVVWGNGNAPAHRLVDLVAQNVSDATGRPVTFLTWAHSGASLQPDSISEPTPKIGSDFAPEVSTDNEAVSKQSACANVDPASVELVVLDGCINDVKADDVAIPWPFNLTTPAQIRFSVFYKCGDPVRQELEQVNQRYPNATIILLSYFRIVSSKSVILPANRSQQASAQQEFTPSAQQRALTKAQTRILSDAQTRNPAKAKILDMNVPVTAEKIAGLPSWPARSDVFLRQTDQCFSWAVANANHLATDPISNTLPTSEMVCPTATLQPVRAQSSARTYLAFYPDDDPTIAYGTHNSFLWKLPWKFLFWTINGDETYKTRHQQCQQFYLRSSGLQREENVWLCTVAETAHPNNKGSRAYAEAIEKQLAFAWAR